MHLSCCANTSALAIARLLPVDRPIRWFYLAALDYRSLFPLPSSLSSLDALRAQQLAMILNKRLPIMTKMVSIVPTVWSLLAYRSNASCLTQIWQLRLRCCIDAGALQHQIDDGPSPALKILYGSLMKSSCYRHVHVGS